MLMSVGGLCNNKYFHSCIFHLLTFCFFLHIHGITSSIRSNKFLSIIYFYIFYTLASKKMYTLVFRLSSFYSDVWLKRAKKGRGSATIRSRGGAITPHRVEGCVGRGSLSLEISIFPVSSGPFPFLRFTCPTEK